VLSSLPSGGEALLNELEHATVRLSDLNPADFAFVHDALAERALAIERLMAWIGACQPPLAPDLELTARIEKTPGNRRAVGGAPHPGPRRCYFPDRRAGTRQVSAGRTAESRDRRPFPWSRLQRLGAHTSPDQAPAAHRGATVSERTSLTLLNTAWACRAIMATRSLSE